METRRPPVAWRARSTALRVNFVETRALGRAEVVVAESNSNGRGGGFMVDVHGIHMETALRSAMDAQYAGPWLLSELSGGSVFCCAILLPIQSEQRHFQRVLCYFILRLPINLSLQKHENTTFLVKTRLSL